MLKAGADARPIEVSRCDRRAHVTALGTIALLLGIASLATGSKLLGAMALCATAAFVWLAVQERSSTTAPVATPDDAKATAASPTDDLLHETPKVRQARVPATTKALPLLKALSDAVVDRGLDAVAAHLWLVDEQSATLRCVASCGSMRPPERPASLEDPVLGDPARGSAALREIARIRGRDGESLVWRFAVPLERAADTPGVVALDIVQDAKPDASVLQEAVSPFLPGLTASLAVCVARRELEDAHAVLAVARDMSRLLDPDAVISTALDRAIAVAEASTGSVMLYDDQAGVLKIARSVGLPPAVLETTLRPGEGIAGWVFSTRQPLLVEDLPDRTRRPARHGVRSSVCVPIADEDDVLGVLNVGAPAYVARFTKGHLDTLELIGKQTAIALRNAQAAHKIRALFFDSLQALVAALETKDPTAQGGTERVLEYSLAIASELGLAGEDLDALRIAALLHDLGMVATGADLRSAGRVLTTVERGLLKAHPRIAAEILADLPAMSAAVPIVYHHHERYDGTGYIDGIAGEDIPLGARILAVADAFVAMTSIRPYRAPMSESAALQEIKSKAGSQFDPAVVNALARVLRAESERAPEPGAR